jgi:Ca2+/H+ antiporter
VGELFGTLVLAVAVTVIEVSLIVFVMLGGGLRMTPAWLVGDGLGFFPVMSVHCYPMVT